MKKYYCPTADYTCPYFNIQNGECEIDGNPAEECDEYAAYCDDEEDDDDV